MPEHDTGKTLLTCSPPCSTATSSEKNKNRLPAAYRYDRDPAFRELVDALEDQIMMGDYTPTELREAAILAATHYEQRTIHSHLRPS